MKTMKKLVAILLAAVMVMALYGVSFAEDLPKAELKITGLNNGDQVELYKVVEWTNGNWAHLAAYNSVNNISDYANMNADKASAIAAKAISQIAVGSATVGENGTFTSSQEPGMYIAIVKSAGTTVYNPMILSVNWDGDTIPRSAKSSDLNVSSSELAAGTTATVAVAKKTDITVDKEVDTTQDTDQAKTVEPGDVVPFKVTTSIPSYADNWINPEFIITDTLSTGLTLQGNVSIKIGDEAAVTASQTGKFTLETTSTGYTITFDSTYLKTAKGNPDVEVTYSAKVGDNVPTKNVDVVSNTVKVEFSNDPHNSQNHGEETVRTNHYTFSIDAGLGGTFGGQNITSELIKVGVDSNGDSVTAWRTTDVTEWSEQTKLSGATFRLVKTDSTADGNTYDKTFVTNANGQIKFEGLEAGTYMLTEETAPAGYVKEEGSHTVEISVVTEDKEVNGVMEKNLLKSYTIKIDGTEKSTYYTTNAASDQINTTSIAATNVTTPIVNTKGLELPTTGGIGTTIFYVAGIVLVLGAAAILVSRRKADAE